MVSRSTRIEKYFARSISCMCRVVGDDVSNRNPALLPKRCVLLSSLCSLVHWQFIRHLLGADFPNMNIGPGKLQKLSRYNSAAITRLIDFLHQRFRISELPRCQKGYECALVDENITNVSNHSSTHQPCIDTAHTVVAVVFSIFVGPPQGVLQVRK